jgi:predicted transcriptional regulator
MWSILMSIKPEFVHKILTGEKKYEFRRVPPRLPLSRYFIYESGTGVITGFFEGEVVTAFNSKDLPEPILAFAGIDQERLIEYARGGEVYVIKVGAPRKFYSPVKFSAVLVGRPPQNFRYLNEMKTRVLNEQLSFDATIEEATK